MAAASPKRQIGLRSTGLSGYMCRETCVDMCTADTCTAMRIGMCVDICTCMCSCMHIDMCRSAGRDGAALVTRVPCSVPTCAHADTLIYTCFYAQVMLLRYRRMQPGRAHATSTHRCVQACVDECTICAQSFVQTCVQTYVCMYIHVNTYPYRRSVETGGYGGLATKMT